MDVAAFIPAKMTSRRMPEKNMRMLCGQPLLYYSIQAARLAQRVDSIIVSSEAYMVLDYARSLGVETHERPTQLSDAKTTSMEVIRHWYQMKAKPPEIVVLLQPTHPLRNPTDIDTAIDQFRSNDADCQFSLVEENGLFGTLEDGLFQPEEKLPRSRPKSKKRYRNTGSFYCFRPETTFLGKKHFGERISGYVVSHPEFEVDIDHESDLRLAEALLSNNRAAFSHFEAE